MEENTMELINEFAEKVLKTNQSFSINFGRGKDSEINYHFIQGNVGKARYIYYSQKWNDDRFYSDISIKPELAAIVSDGIIYITNTFAFRIYDMENITLPDNVKLFDDYVNKINQYINDVIFKKYYESLDAFEIKDEDLLAKCRNKARTYLLSKAQRDPFCDECVNNFFKWQDIANALCGFIEMKEEAMKRLKTNEDVWLGLKSRNKVIRKMIKEKSGVSNLELKIAEALRSVDAKNVVVEFKVNGKKVSGRISPDRICYTLINRLNFYSSDFVTNAQGEEVLNYLGLNDYESRKKLNCESINRITYKRQTLYSRE